MRTFFIENFGCRATQADGAALETLLQQQGLQRSSRPEAELVILNTCTVTASADSDVRAVIRKVHRENPDVRVLVTGCYAQRAPAELAVLPSVEWVVGNSHKSQIPSLVTSAPFHGGIHVGDVFAADDLLTAPVVESLADRARPNLKIQDGCGNRCSFCIIPSVRGGNRFLPAEAVVAQIKELAGRYREVVLTGINLGRWGRSGGGKQRLADLLRSVLDKTAVGRIRISSVEPMDWSDDLIELVAAEPRIAPHFHVPLQSGSDRILRAMHRKYRPRHYAERIWRMAEAAPGAAIGADVMTGFPGETDELFEESRAFIERLPFTYLHVFTYSERPGTAAASLPGSIPLHVRKQRNAILRELGARKNEEFRRRMIGTIRSAVTLEETPFALTDNYIRVRLQTWPGANQIVEARLSGLEEGGMREVHEFHILR